MIQLCGLSFTYAGSGEGVREIDLMVAPGECVVLTGRSGNGKTTLTRLINGLAPQYYPGELTGDIRIQGQETAQQPLWMRGKIIGSVFQDPKSQFFSSSLTGEVAFACENYGFAQSEIVERTERALGEFGLCALRGRSVDLLSSGEKQRTAMASVYALGPKVYVCDEPTANLDEEGALRLSEVLARLKKQGHALVIAEHRLSWLRHIADRVVYMEEGRLLWQRSAAEMAGLKEEERFRYGLRSFFDVKRPGLPEPDKAGTPLICAENLTVRRSGSTIWAGVDFKAHAGQVVAVTGGNGAGKTTLAKVLSGLIRENAGTVRLNGKNVSLKARRKRVWYSDNDTGTQFFTNSVSEELLLGLERSDAVLERARALLRQLQMYAYKDAHPAALSGGQKQRLSVACGLLSGRDVLIFDEPTSGLDGASLALVGKMLRQAAEDGKCVLVITHDNELIQNCCTHLFSLDGK